MVRHFSKAGHNVIATGRWETPQPGLLEHSTYLKWDIREVIELPEADAIIHCAALSDDKAKLKELVKHNVLGSLNVVEASANIKRFVFISSSSVYVHQREPLKEEDASLDNIKQLSPYGISKLQSEVAIIEAMGSRTCDILRPRALYGIGDRKIIPRIFKFVKNEVLQVPGTMECMASMTQYKNMARAIECCLRKQQGGVNVYNVSDEIPEQLIGVVRALCEIAFGRRIPEKNIPIWVLHILALFGINGVSKLLVKSLTQDMVLDISKIQLELGYREATNFQAELDDLQKWFHAIGGFEVISNPPKSLSWDQT